jgi:hypothetical protein
VKEAVLDPGRVYVIGTRLSPDPPRVSTRIVLCRDPFHAYGWDGNHAGSAQLRKSVINKDITRGNLGFDPSYNEVQIRDRARQQATLLTEQPTGCWISSGGLN